MNGSAEYFKQSLSDFTFDVAAGGAIRHLADRGYTVGEITKMLDFPTPFERVQQTVWKHFVEKGIVLLKEPERENEKEEYSFVTEYDSYGRKSFRRVVTKERSMELIRWRQSRFCKAGGASLLDFLEGRCGENGVEYSYVSCDFGLYKRKDPKGFERLMERLEVGESAYIKELPWERKMVYHRLDRRMQRITACLREAGHPCTCYFIRSREKVEL